MRRHSLVLCALALSWISAAQAQAQDKFALQLFHFNVQYVCGGTLGYTPLPNPLIDLDNDEIEDRIITESFAPIVELFAKHPDWGVDLEMQAYMLDIIAARHPALLDKMRAMAKSGQIDINSFHYSDQLFIAYPQQDWERSQQLTAATFAKHDVPLSRSVFCQEGQSAMAMADHFGARGYRTMVWPKNLWIYQHGDFDPAPLYAFGDQLMIVGSKGVSYDQGGVQIEVTWTFLDDGELLATNDFNPYFPELFYEDPKAVAAYEQKLQALADQGYTITTVDKYVEAIEDKVTPAAPPPLLDGTWQPSSTTGVKRWLGGGGLFKIQERDNHVRTVGAQAHRELVAAETIAEHAGLEARAKLDAAWRMLFLGQVTDATGINPFRGEIEYGIAHMAEAMRLAREVINEAKTALSLKSVLIDPTQGPMEGGDDGLRGQASEAPIEVVVSGGDRTVRQRWEKVGQGHHRLQIDFGPGEYDIISVTFPGKLEPTFEVGLALADDTPVAVSRDAFTFEQFHFALPTGYLGLGDGRFVIKDMGHVHLAATVQRDSGDVVFEDQTVPVEDNVRWVFHTVEASAAGAAALAARINVDRSLLR